MEKEEFIEKAKKAGMSEKQILECLAHEEESQKHGYSSLEADLNLFKDSVISYH